MVPAIPPALKAADIARFAQRAGQVERAKPAVAYWCKMLLDLDDIALIFFLGYYWIVEQIIAKGLHQADDESKSYTMNIMDKLEAVSLESSQAETLTESFAFRPSLISKKTTPLQTKWLARRI